MDRQARRIRIVWPLLLTAACSTASMGFAQAQTSYPVRPVQVIVGFPASGSVDLMARRGAAEMSSLLGQNFVVVNRDGASGTIGFNLISGRVDFSGTSIASVIGRGLRPLGFFGEERHPAFPDIPTLQELGIPSLPGGLNGFFAPKGTPVPILNILETSCEKLTRSESFQEAAKKLNQRVKFLSGCDFAKKTAEDFRLKAELVKTLGLATP